MDTSADVAVSLDELTFELTVDDIPPPAPELADFTDVTCVPENDPVGHNDPIGVTEDSSINNSIGSDEIGPFVTKEFSLIKETEQQDTNTQESVNKTGKILIEAPEFEDFEADVPPLTLFPSSRDTVSDDSDSEFEVPERPPNSVSEQKSNGLNNERQTNETVEKNENKADNDDCGIDLKAASFGDVQPEILTARDKVSSDLTLEVMKTVEDNAEKGDSTNASDHLSTSDVTKDNVIEEINTENTVQGFKSSEEQPKNNDTSFGEESNAESHKPSIITTAEDWDDVQTVEPGFAKPGEKSKVPAALIESKPLATFPESWTHFETQDYSSVKSQVKTQIERKGFSAFTHLLFGPPKMHKDLLPQRELVFCVAATPLDNENGSHIQVLQTVYRCLTGSKFDCQRYGGHWEEIGFQGRDPATDLRGAGMLALLHLLSFLRDPHTKDLARDVYKLSLHPTQNFPFCIMGINLSRICLQVLREDIFNRECNRRADVPGTLNSVYAALFLQLFKVWKTGKTIADSGFVLQDVEAYCRKQSKNVFRDLEMYEQSRKNQGPFGELPQQGDPAFFSVCKEDDCDDKIAAELY